MMKVDCNRPWLVATLPALHRMVSWSLNRPGFVEGRQVAWLEVGDGELRAVTDVAAWFQGRLDTAGLGDAVGLLTARNVATHEIATSTVEGITARCLITLGLNNGERAGQRVGNHLHPLNAGTINLLCITSMPLTDAALLEAASVAAQARTLALVEAGYRRPGRDEIVTGTGTDCIVTAAPLGPDALPFAGTHTAAGEAIGACVIEATRRATLAWMASRR